MPVRAYEWLRRFELDLCKRVDHVVAVSKLDRDSLVEYGVGSDKLTVIPHGVDYFAFQRDYGIGLREAYGVPVEFPILVYHGIYSYAPNLEAVELVATEILPRLADRGVLVEFFAIGPEPPTANLNPHVRFTGAVENVVPYLKSANLAIVPLQQGGGTRMKVLEYFAAGVPVVATAKALDGIPVKDGVHVLVEDSFEGMADAICRLLEDPIKQARLAKRAKQFVSELDWLHIASCYSALLR
jgi:glycosyltransferase involved in cell wall biosynthesis